MAWLTPSDNPDLTTWVVFLPDGLEWIAAFLGAFMDLAESENWEEFGTMTPEDTAAKWAQALKATIDENTNS
jgi:hypothetical protein